MKGLIIYIVGFLLFAGQAAAQKTFPPVKGTTLDGKEVEIPFDNGKYTVLAIAFDRDAEDALKKWLQPLYDNFIQKESSDPFDMAEYYDVNFVFIPLIQGFKRVAEEFKKNTDAHFWSYIVDTEKTDIKSLREKLGVKDTKEPYFFVLDPKGKVVKSVHGCFSEEKLALLEAPLD